MKRVCTSCKRELDEFGRLYPNKSPGGYLIPLLSTDSIIKIKNKFLIRRLNDELLLHGVELNYNISAENCIIEYIKNKLNCNIEKKDLVLFNTYGNPNRGYKYHNISIVYIIKLDDYQVNMKDECLLSIEEIKASKDKFLYDHYSIISDYINLF